MAATNFTPIQLYYSTTASAAPVSANLANGELAINITDGKLFYKDNGGTVQVLATKGTGTIGGSNTQVQYNSSGALAGSANFTFNGTTATINTLNLTNALGTTYGGTGLNSYTTGDIVYASASNTLSKLTIGTNGYILTSNGTIPTWTAGSSISVNTATNLAGGATGSVPYQSGAGATTFLSIGSANTVLTSSGTGPQWVTSLSSLTGVSSSSMTNTSLTSGRVVYSTTGGAQTDSASLTFNGTTLTAGGFATGGSSTLDKLVKIGDSAFNLPAVLSATAPAKLYVSTATVTDASSAGGATNSLGTITSFGSTTVAASNSGVTYTNLATLYIAGAPTAGTNVTITNPYALYVAAGDAYFGGTVTAGTVNLTTLDLTNLEVTNIKAKDGTASITLADTTGVASFTANPVMSGGTANGVAYLNGSKVLTTGSALTFDGTNFGVGFTANSRGGVVMTTTNNSGTSEQGGYQVTNGNGTGLFAGVNGASYSTGGIGNANNAVLYTIGNTDLVFGRNTSEAMRLTSTGLGIGTSSPTTTYSKVVQINGDSNAGLRITTGGYTSGYDMVVGSDGTTYLLNRNNTPLTFGTNNTERMRLDSSGNLGIGTSSPIGRFDASGALARLRWNLDSNSYVYQVATNPSDTVYLQNQIDALSHVWKLSGTQAMTLDASGNLGIGVTPSAWSASFKAMQISNFGVMVNAANGNTYQLANAYFDGSYKYLTTAPALRYEMVGGAFAWSVAPSGTAGNAISFTQAMTLDASGNLGIGTSSPAWKLTLSDGTTTGGMIPNGGNLYLGTISNHPLLFRTNNTDRMTLSADGNLGLGVTPSAWSAGKAIEVSAVGNSIWGVGAGEFISAQGAYYNSGYKYANSSYAVSAYDQYRGAHIWQTAPSGTAGDAISFTQAMTLDASGNLLLGTTTQLARANFAESVISGEADVLIGNSAVSGTNNTAALYLSGQNSLIRSAAIKAVIGSSNEHYMAFFTNGAYDTPAERARITSGGYFKASDNGTYSGVTSAWHEFYQSANDIGLIARSINASYTSHVLAVSADRNTTNTSYYFIRCDVVGVAYRFQVADSGNVTNTNGSYGTISDAKMKTDIVDAGSQWADIKAIRFRKFKMKDDPSGLLQLGVVAQELEQTSPGLVEEHTDRDAQGNDLGTTTKSVKTSVLLMKAAVALQEAMARIEALEAKVAALEAA